MVQFFLDYEKFRPWSFTSEWLQPKKLQELLGSRPQTRNFTNTRKKTIKQRKKPRRLSFKLLLCSLFNLATYSHVLIHHIIRLLRSLISGWSVACLLHINFHLAQRVGEYVNITSRERMASNDVTNADASATPDKKFFKRFPVSLNTHGSASRMAQWQSLQRGNHYNAQHHCLLAWCQLSFSLCTPN